MKLVVILTVLWLTPAGDLQVVQYERPLPIGTTITQCEKIVAKVLDDLVEVTPKTVEGAARARCVSGVPSESA